MLLGFLVGLAMPTTLVGLHLQAEKEAAQPLPYFSLKEVVNPEGVATNFKADLRFDTGEGYNRFDILPGFYKTFLTECLKSESRKKGVYYITSNS